MRHHSHDHSAHDQPAHDHSESDDRERDRRRLLATLVLTAVILVAEVLGGLWSHSLALLSDAGHMLSDVGAQVFSLFALTLATRPADARRTYGYYRVEILAALGNGVTLLGLAGWILWSAVARLRQGVPPIDVGMMTVIAAIGLAANLGGAFLLRGAHSLNVRGAYLHILTDTLSSVAVLAGGIVMWLAHGWYTIDPILSIAIGLFVAYSAFRLTREAVDILLEGVPAEVDIAAVTRSLAGVAGVLAVHDLHIWTITSGIYALSAHLVIDDASLADSAGSDRILGEVNAALARDCKITHTTFQIESRGYQPRGHECL